MVLYPRGANLQQRRTRIFAPVLLLAAFVITDGLIAAVYLGPAQAITSYPGAAVSLHTAWPEHCLWENLSTSDPPQRVADYYRNRYLSAGWVSDILGDGSDGEGNYRLSFSRIGRWGGAIVEISSKGDVQIREQLTTTFDECRAGYELHP